MTTTVTPPSEGQKEPPAPGRRSWLVPSILGFVVLAVAVAIGVVWLAGSDDDTTSAGDDNQFTHVYELNGSLDDANGGPALVATGGTVGPEGFVFEPGDGLAADIDLGDSYTMEFRVRIDQSGHAIKLFDFSDLATDGGLYVFEGSELMFWFSEGCDGRIDEAQGCSFGSRRYPMAAGPYEFEPGTWVTVKFARDDETSTLSAEIDGTVQTWEFRGDPRAEPIDFTAQPVANADDFMGEATQVATAPLYVLFDDSATTSETGSGELDYLKITTP